LARGAYTFPGSELARPSLLTDVAMGAEPEVCLHGSQGQGVHEVWVGSEITSLPSRTFSDVQNAVNRPTPESEPCLPCHDIPPMDQGGGGGGGGSGLTVGAGTITTAGGGGSNVGSLQLTGPVAVVSDLTVDMSGSAGLPSERELLGVYLRVGGHTYRFTDSEHPGLLADLAAGRVEHLHVSNLPVNAFREQVSLVWLERLASGLVRDLYTSSSPIAVHGH
jgi:hypothetical protein